MAPAAMVHVVPTEGGTGEALDMPNFSRPTGENSQAQIISSPSIEMSEVSNSQQLPRSPSAGYPSTSPQARRKVISTDITQNAGVSAEAPLILHEVNRGRSNSIPPIGPGSPIMADQAMEPLAGKISPEQELDVEGPVLYITLLLTTGARHPFRLDQKYLKKRHVEVEGNNPVNMSLYKLKELILRDWRNEWEAKPSSPESIRLISMGKLLTDKSKLFDLGFKDGAAPAIVHMTIKPQEVVDEEEANKNPRDREGNERTPRCRSCGLLYLMKGRDRGCSIFTGTGIHRVHI
ncbi:MAG: hypothetical protein Q9163_004998 [Psora crenata]